MYSIYTVHNEYMIRDSTIALRVEILVLVVFNSIFPAPCSLPHLCHVKTSQPRKGAAAWRWQRGTLVVGTGPILWCGVGDGA